MLYPAALFLLLRWGATARTINNTILGTVAVSFTMAVIGNWLFPAGSFFLLPARIWELMLGALIAQVSLPTISLPVRQALCVIGAIFIACGIAGFRFGFSEIAPPPLIACLGTAILIYTNSGMRTVASAFLSSALLVWIGLLSYSLYLWHWPILVLYRYAISKPFGMADAAMVAIATLLASILSWKYVEQPIRTRSLLGKRAGIYLVAASASTGLLVVAIWGVVTKGIPNRLSAHVMQLAQGKADTNPDRSQCIDKEPTNVLTGAFCRLGEAGTPSLMVWGDSQADPWMPVFNDFAREHKISGLIAAHGGCPPLLGVKRPSREPAHKCTEFNNAVFTAIVTNQIKRVVLIGRWSWYIYGVEKDGLEEGPGAIIARTDENDENAGEIDNRKRVFRATLTETVVRLRQVGAQVWVIQEPPTYKVEVPKYLAYSALKGTPATGRLPDEVRQRQAFQASVFAESNLAIIDVFQYLCPSGETYCRIALDGKSLYSDYNHLSVFGARAIAQWAAPVVGKIAE
jgi:hypothetical protein